MRRGIGVAVGGWTGGVEPSSAVCRLNGDGSLQVVIGSVDISGTNTGFAMIAAEAFGVSDGAVNVSTPDSDSAPYAGASGGSKITYTVGAAVERAARDARDQVLAIAADVLEASREDLELADSRVQVRGAPDRSLSLTDVAGLSTGFGSRYPPVFGRGSSSITARAPAFAAHLAEVEIDPETGLVRLLSYVAVQDVGRALNPEGIRGQIRGGVAQGVGWALLEKMAYEPSGRLVSATLLDYALPGTHDVSHIQPVLVEVPSDDGPFGAKGVGEPPVIPAAAAIANAVADATGHRFTDLPISSEVVSRALREAG